MVYEPGCSISPPAKRGPQQLTNIKATRDTHPDNLQCAPISDI